MKQYLAERSALFNAGSEFSCPDSCERLGCRHPDLHIPVSLVDLVALSLASGRSVVDLFRNDCKMGFDPLTDEDPWVGRLSIELRKPCHFLNGKICDHYPGRPIACALFPESFFILESPETLLGKEIFRGFPCVVSPFAIPPKRGEVLHLLMEMWMKEAFLSDFFLFGISPFLIDLKSIAGEVLEGILIPEQGKAKIPLHRIEELISMKLSQGGYKQDWEDKIARLERPGGLDALAEMKRQTDPIARDRNRELLTMAHQFDGRRLLPVRHGIPSPTREIGALAGVTRATQQPNPVTGFVQGGIEALAGVTRATPVTRGR